MALSLDQIKERIVNPANSPALREAQNHENRIKLHTKAVDSQVKASVYFTEFLRWVEHGIKLPSDKMAAFKGMCQFPLATTALCNSIFDEYEKIFTAQDSYFDVELLDDTMKVAYKKYLQDINIRRYFQTVVFRAYQKQPACIFVVDLPAVQNSERPNPYFYKVSIGNIVDIGISKNTSGAEKIDYLIYRVGGKRFVHIDDQSYVLLEETDESTLSKRDFRVISASQHGLGYAPATFLSHTSLYDDEDNNQIARKTQMSDVLGDLDWLLFFKIAARLYETYGPFPIMTIPEDDCTFEDANGNACTNGFVSYMKADGTTTDSYACPACQKNSIVGPGTIFHRPTRKSKDDPELGNAVEITPPHIMSLDYIAKHIDTLEWEIYANCVGSADETVTKEAVNQKQVQVTVEGKRNVLLRIKRDFEATEKFLVDTMGKLMYGDYYVNAIINYGEQFLLYTAKEIAEQLRTFKEVGVAQHMIDQKKRELTQAEYKNNPYEQKRAELLNILEPFSNLSPKECMDYGIHEKYPEKFLLKLDFAKYISMFELTNGNIVNWGSAISVEKKVESLTSILLKYVKKSISEQSDPSGERANADTAEAGGVGRS